MDILRITARWAGFPGAPGYSNFHFTSDAGFWDGGVLNPDAEAAAQTAADLVLDAAQNFANYLPSGVTFETESEAVLLDSDSGEMIAMVDIESNSVSNVSQEASFAGPVGAVVNWRTADYRFGRRIRGRTFVVPLSVSGYGNDGTLTSNVRDGIRAFGNELVTGVDGPEFGVWSRPRDGAGGVFATATGSSVPDLAAVLRSRRD